MIFCFFDDVHVTNSFCLAVYLLISLVMSPSTMSSQYLKGFLTQHQEFPFPLPIEETFQRRKQMKFIWWLKYDICDHQTPKLGWAGQLFTINATLQLLAKYCRLSAKNY